ncbi:DsbA family protein [Hymenobacter actinosclerus]|uniref:Protein-disulfide isomerase n=1 Tax=Hymenobacter actinosclerus TaxID=82805 RepID=A0A1I0IA37_9BACT|nr:DsbA family protein [Hymenobacter actinosclerus]SET93284.1 Protein-disulfide isomerase [Hymenobacter actinosclerus]
MSNQLKPAVDGHDHSQGPRSAPLELVEYGDYQCSYCGEAYPEVKAARQALGDKLRFVFRNFPLTEAHPHAQQAALAAEAAARQGKFWEMHDALYEHQDQLDSAGLQQHAQQLELDMDQFQSDLKSSAVTEKVEADFESGVRSGVNGTPAFFVNGELYQGNWQDGELTRFLQSQLQ